MTNLRMAPFINPNKYLVSKETVVLYCWRSETLKFGFIKQVDEKNVELPPWKIWKAGILEPFVRVNDEGLMR